MLNFKIFGIPLYAFILPILAVFFSDKIKNLFQDLENKVVKKSVACPSPSVPVVTGAKAVLVKQPVSPQSSSSSVLSGPPSYPTLASKNLNTKNNNFAHTKKNNVTV